MKTLTIRLLPGQTSAVFTCDGKELSFKMNKTGYYESIYQSDNEEVNLKIDTLPSELAEKHWGRYFTAIFLASIFTLFNPPYPKSDFFALNYVGKIDMKNNPIITLAFANPVNDGRALLLRDEMSQLYFRDNASNVYKLDAKAKKRRSLINFLRAMMILLFLFGFIALTILLAY